MILSYFDALSFNSLYVFFFIWIYSDSGGGVTIVGATIEGAIIEEGNELKDSITIKGGTTIGGSTAIEGSKFKTGRGLLCGAEISALGDSISGGIDDLLHSIEVSMHAVLHFDGYTTSDLLSMSFSFVILYNKLY